jgi:hypothetical protein
MTSRILFATLSLAGGLLLMACGTDCRKTMRDAEFEFTQRNFARAEKLFDEAYKQDPAKCADAQDRRAEAVKFMGR